MYNNDEEDQLINLRSSIKDTWSIKERVDLKIVEVEEKLKRSSTLSVSAFEPDGYRQLLEDTKKLVSNLRKQSNDLSILLRIQTELLESKKIRE